MEWWQALILGIVQGLTEFLPVSSSGHLVLLQRAMGVTGDDDVLKAFDVALHAGTFLAVVVFFRTDLARMLKAWGRSVVDRRIESTDQRLSWLIFIGTLPAILAYLVAGEQLDQVEDNMAVVAAMLIGVSFIFILAEHVGSRTRTESDLRWWDGVLIGVAQAVSLIPGTSRSGATISAGLLLGIDRTVAARFSFLLGTPAVFGAFVLKAPDLTRAAGADTGFLVATVIGFLAALGFGVLAIGVLLRFLAHHSLSWFALYRIPAGMFFLWLFFAR